MECEVSKQRAVVWWYTVSSQSLGEKWAGVAGQERGSRVAAARKASPTQRPQKLPRRLDIARAPIHRVGKAELSPNNIITDAREQSAREPSHLPNASSPSSRRSLKISHTIFPQFTKHPPLYAPPTAVIAPVQVQTYHQPPYHRQNGRQKIRTRPAEGGR